MKGKRKQLKPGDVAKLTTYAVIVYAGQLGDDGSTDRVCDVDYGDLVLVLADVTTKRDLFDTVHEQLVLVTKREGLPYIGGYATAKTTGWYGCEYDHDPTGRLRQAGAGVPQDEHLCRPPPRCQRRQDRRHR